MLRIYPNYLKMPFHSTPIFIHSVVVPLYRGQPCASSRLALNKNRRTLNSAFSSSLGIFTIIMLVIFMVTGCKTIDSLKCKQKATELSNTLTYYVVAWRWAHHKDALTYHVDAKGVQPDIDLALYKDFRVTGIKTSERLINPDQTEAFITFEITYYDENQASIQTKKVQQRWWYSEEFRQWYTYSEFPKLD